MEVIGNLRWFAILVRSRCEKVAAADLIERGFEVCGAVAAQQKVWADRVRIVETPLFPGYIFARFDPERHRIQVERAAGVASVVRFGNRECPIDDAEIEGIRAVLRSGNQVLSSPFLQVGARVRVRSGPLASVVGILKRVKSRYRLVVSVSLLQRSVAVEIDEALVEPLPAPWSRCVRGVSQTTVA